MMGKSWWQEVETTVTIDPTVKNQQWWNREEE